MDIDFILKTKRLLLRPLTVNDVDTIWSYVADPEISKNMSWEAHKDKSKTKMFLQRIQNEYQEGKSFHWGIFFENQFCGIISLISIIRKHRSLIYNKAELAYWLGSEFRKKGFMTEAGEIVIDFAFNKLGFHRLTVGHIIQNKESEKLIKRWNFKCIGEEREAFMKNGKWYNHKLYELLDKDHNISK